jgi:tRNA pseudouridine38-40 synthase
MRIALGIEYDGSEYNGWQRQRSGIGVQTLVEKAISCVADEGIEVTCAGRTDSGVHASAQVVHFDTVAKRSDREWLLGMNSNLPADVNIVWATTVDAEFHARFSAVSRTYRYLILNRQPRSSLYRHRAWWQHHPIDASRMQEAAVCLTGKHDFSAFRAAGCQASTPHREVRSIDVQRREDWISISITANAYLQHMVRNVAGLLVAVGKGEKPVDWAASVLQSRDRTRGGVTAPPQGLTLIDVEYPSRFSIPDFFVYDAPL